MGRILLITTALLNSVFCLAQYKSTVTINNSDASVLYSQMERNISTLLTEFNAAFFEKRSLKLDNIDITNAGKARISSLWENGFFRCTETLLKENLLKLPEGNFQLRNLPILILTADNAQKHEEGVINFNTFGFIDDIYFGIEQHKYKSLMSKGSSLQDFRRRQIILDFLENFRTAYNRKDLDMLQMTFSDNALIIVGRVVEEKSDSPEMILSLGKKKVELIRYNKQQYLSNLSRVFSTNSFIDVRFDEIEIVKHPGIESIYGVNLKQTWRSKAYGDEGYLFLMIDFEIESRPLVHVRSWQPFKETPRDEVIELGDFDIIK